MDELETARRLADEGRLHDALQLAQAFCERHPRHLEGWRLLAAIGERLGMSAASGIAHRRVAELERELN